MLPILAYNDSSLPAPSLGKRLQISAQQHLALEIGGVGNLALEPYLKAEIQIPTAKLGHTNA